MNARLLQRYAPWAAVIVAWGFATRIARWSSGLSLSTDELFIAINLAHRGFGDLRGRLEYDQVAPVGWLWLERLAYSVSREEMVLRLPALLAGCGLLAAMAVVARRLLPAPLALGALALVAGSPVLLYWSNQLKPYSVEAAATVVLLLLAMRDGRIAPFWTAAAVLPWLGATAVFAAGAIGGALLVRSLLTRRWMSARRHALGAVPFGLSALGVYLLSPRVEPWIYGFWSTNYPAAFAPPTMDLPTWWTWSADVLGRLSTAMDARWSSPVVWLLLLGAVALAVRRPAHAPLVCAPLVAAYALAWLRVYPLAGRVAVWVVPVGLLLVVAAIDGLVHAGRSLWSSARRRGALTAYAAALGAIVVVAVAFGLSLGRAMPDMSAERYAVAEEAVRYIAANQRAGDRVYFRDTSAPLAVWYGPAAGLRWDGAYTTAGGRRCRDDPATLRIDGVARVWLVLRAWGDNREAMVSQARTMLLRYGRPEQERWYGAFVVLLYDVAPPSRPPRDSRCLLVAVP